MSDRPDSDRRTGTILRAIAVFGVVVALVATVVAWRFVGDLDRSVDRSLRVGEEAAVTLSDTIDIADDVISSLDDGLATIDATLGTIEGAIGDTGSVAASVAELAGRLPASFDDIDATLATVESLGAAIDDALRTASRIPLGPDYDPDVAFPDAIANLRAALAPVGEDLAEISTALGRFADDSGALGEQASALRDELAETRRALDASADLLDRYRTTAEEARQLAATSHADLDRSIGWARLVIVLLGLLIACSQYLPWWLGTRLRQGNTTVLSPTSRIRSSAQ